MKFKFSLQKVLEFRKIKEEIAQKDFLEVQNVYLHEEQKLTQMINELKEARNLQGRYERRGGTTVPNLVTINEYILGQEVRIKAQRAKVEDLEKLVESKQEFLRKMAQEYKIIERLKEKKFDLFKQEKNKKEQAEIDEYTVLRFRLKEE